MARRKRSVHHHEREDGTFSPTGGVAMVERSGSSTNVHDHLQSLQRSYGNRAVTAMVQRAPRRRRRGGGAASTDNPHYKAAPKAADFFPKDHSSPGLASRSVAWLEYVAALEYRNGSKQRALLMYEELVYKQRRDINAVKKYAMPLHLAYASIDDARSDYWRKVAKGDIVPEETKSIGQIIKEMDAAEAASKSF